MPRLHLRQTAQQLLSALYRRSSGSINHLWSRFLDLLIPRITTWPNGRQKATVISFFLLYVGTQISLAILAGVASGTLNVLAAVVYKLSQKIMALALWLLSLSTSLTNASRRFR